MYCILVTGIPAAGKTTIAEFLSERLQIPVISKDNIKELMFDSIGFESREEKVKLGVASMNIMYYFAEQLMKRRQPFLLENNFENASKDGLFSLLEKYVYTAITVMLTGDYPKIYQRFLERNNSPDRHRGHVVNDCFPEKCETPMDMAPLSYDNFAGGIEKRGMDSFVANGPVIVLDMTDFSKVDREALVEKIVEFAENQSRDLLN